MPETRQASAASHFRLREKGLNSVQTKAMVELADSLIVLHQCAVAGDLDGLEMALEKSEELVSKTTPEVGAAVAKEFDLVGQQVALHGGSRTCSPSSHQALRGRH